jgi:hypothetical protein
MSNLSASARGGIFAPGSSTSSSAPSISSTTSMESFASPIPTRGPSCSEAPGRSTRSRPKRQHRGKHAPTLKQCPGQLDASTREQVVEAPSPASEAATNHPNAPTSLATGRSTRWSPLTRHAPHAEGLNRIRSTRSTEQYPASGNLPRVAETIVGPKHLSKVLMDGASRLNVMYIETFDALGIALSALHPSTMLIYVITPDHSACSLEQIVLPVTFANPSNFRTEQLQFELMNFLGAYNAILGRSGYVKFMVIPNYTYLKLMMSGPHGVITASASFQATYVCEKASCELASAQATARELVELWRGIDSRDGSDAPNVSSDTFKCVDDTKDVRIDNADTSKHVRIGVTLSTNKKVPLSTSSKPIVVRNMS